MNEARPNNEVNPAFEQANELLNANAEADQLEVRVINGDLKQLNAMAETYDATDGPRTINPVVVDGLIDKWQLPIDKDLDGRQKLAALQAALIARKQAS